MITFVKRPGAILEAGSLIAKLTLDDPNQCRTFALYSGKFWNFMLILSKDLDDKPSVTV
jgi:hypothetical protein